MSINIHDLLCLSSVPRIGPLKLRALVTHFKSPTEALRAAPRELLKVQGIDKSLALAVARHKGGESFAGDQLRHLNKIGGRIITLWDKDYPDLLKRIYDPPPFLFVLGRFEPDDRYALAVVGTRTPSLYGQKVAETFSSELSLQGVSIVSGLARGVDTIAHSAALKSGGRTIAVIGSGLDVPYPPENKKLLETIAGRGIVVSEFPMGTKPDAPNFPRRNRIISGLSLGTIVIESGEDGGAMITASTALDQDREVFALPGSVLEKRSAGPHRLIREGRAMLVNSTDDIVEELRTKLKPILKENRGPEMVIELSLFERKIIDALKSEPLHIDVIAEATSLSTSDSLVTLLGLEFKDLVKQLPGKFFVRV